MSLSKYKYCIVWGHNRHFVFLFDTQDTVFFKKETKGITKISCIYKVHNYVINY